MALHAASRELEGAGRRRDADWRAQHWHATTRRRRVGHAPADATRVASAARPLDAAGGGPASAGAEPASAGVPEQQRPSWRRVSDGRASRLAPSWEADAQACRQRPPLVSGAPAAKPAGERRAHGSLTASEAPHLRLPSTGWCCHRAAPRAGSKAAMSRCPAKMQGAGARAVATQSARRRRSAAQSRRRVSPHKATSSSCQAPVSSHGKRLSNGGTQW